MRIDIFIVASRNFKNERVRVNLYTDINKAKEEFASHREFFSTLRGEDKGVFKRDNAYSMSVYAEDGSFVVMQRK